MSPALTSEDLISIGATSVGDRRNLLAAIAMLAAAPADAARRQLTVDIVVKLS